MSSNFKLDQTLPWKSQVVGKFLSPAVRLWLRSQLDSVEDLQFKLEGGDRQFLSGCIARVSVAARQLVYQGLQLSHIQLVGENIQVNLGQILCGKPLRLLDAFPVRGEVLIQEMDLNASVQASLLATAVKEGLIGWLQSVEWSGKAAVAAMLPETMSASKRSYASARLQNLLQSNTENLTVANLSVVIGSGWLKVSGWLVPAQRSTGWEAVAIAIRTELHLFSERELQLVRPQLLAHPQATSGEPLQLLDGAKIDLGPDVSLQALELYPGKLVCRGSITVMPSLN